MRTLITGPPASGKTTLAHEMAARRGATVVDYDEIAVELGSPDPWDHPATIRSRAAAEFERRVRETPGPLVVVRSAPTQAERDEWAQVMAADEVLVLDVSRREAKARAERDARPSWMADAIDRWWDRHQPMRPPRPESGGTNPKTGEPTMSEQAQQQTTPDATANADPEAIQLPDDHPLVKSLAAQKAEIKALKEKASRLDALEEQQKTAEQKAAEREAAATQRAVEAEARALRREVALEHNLTKEDAALLDGVVDEDAMRNLAKRLSPQSRRGSNTVPREGTQQAHAVDDERAAARKLFGRS